MKKTKKKITKEVIEKEVYSSGLIEDAIAEEEKTRKKVNKILTILGILGPLITIPYIINIYFIKQSAAGASIVLWGAYLIVATIWFAYGLIYKDKTIAISYGLWTLFNIIILNGIYFFR